MATDFHLFSPQHAVIVAAIPLAGLILAGVCRRGERAARRLRFAAAAFLAVNEIVWWVYRYATEGVRFPEGLPLQLCDVTVWAAIAALLTLNRWCYDVAYFAGIAGGGMAVLTPDLWAPLWSYPSMYFFAAHGGTIAGVLLLTWGRVMQPAAGSLARAVIVLNGYAAGIGIFNVCFGTNYMYLCRKPTSASLLDAMGPWPVYLVVAEAVALALFWALYAPFRTRPAPVTRARAAAAGAGR